MRRALGVLAAVLGVSVVGGPVIAQTEGPGANLGGYDAQAAAMAVSFQPVFPALLPTGDAPVEFTLALTTGQSKSGGNSFGRAAIIWPGSAASDPGPLIGAGFGQEEFGALFPKWPLQAQATQDDGEVVTGMPPGIQMRATGEPDRGAGDVRIADLDVPGLVLVEHVASTSDTVVTDGSVTSVARVTLHGVSLLGGHITAEKIRSISRTSSTGTTATNSGAVDIVGMKIGGVDVSVTDDGFHIAGLPPDAEQMPGAGEEPFPGQSPEEQVRQVLENLNARITLFEGVGESSEGRARHIEIGLVLSIDNPVGGQGPIPPGRFDLILGSSASSSFASPPFVAEVAGFEDAATLGVTAAPAASIGEGPEVAPTTPPGVGERLAAPDPQAGETVTFGEIPGVAGQRSDYQFGGVPVGMTVGLLLFAALVARYIRNFFNAAMTRRE